MIDLLKESLVRRTNLAFLLISFFGIHGVTSAAPAWQAGMKDLYDLAHVDVQPEVISRTPPDYPETLYKRGISGSATIVFLVNKEGLVPFTTISQATHPEFGVAAAKAVATWKFRPAMKRGRVVNCKLAVPINFDIDKKPEPKN